MRVRHRRPGAGVAEGYEAVPPSCTGGWFLVSFGDHENSSFWRVGGTADQSDENNKQVVPAFPFSNTLIKMDQAGEFHRAERKSRRCDASEERIASVRIPRRGHHLGRKYATNKMCCPTCKVNN